MRRVKGNPDAHSHLTDWGLNLNNSTVMLQGRVLDPERILFGRNYSEMVSQKADWGRAATTKHVLTAVNLTKWAIVFFHKNENIVKAFCSTFREQAPR